MLFFATKSSEARIAKPAHSPAKVPFRFTSNGLQLISFFDSGITPSFPKEIIASKLMSESVPPTMTSSASPLAMASYPKAMA